MSLSGPTDPTYWGLVALAAFVVFVLQGVWIVRDARRRDYDARLAIFFYVALWPLSIPIWFLVRSGNHLAPRDHGSGWG